MPNNGIATAEDFKKAAAQTNPPERVVLPSGLAVLLRRPTTMYVWLMDERLAELEAAQKWVEAREVVKEAVRDAMVEPQLSLEPSPGKIHPKDLPKRDETFIIHWVKGFITADGTDLVEEFFREGRPAESGAGGEGTEHAALEDPGIVGAVRDAS